MSESLGLILLKAGVITPRDLIEAHTRSSDEPLAGRLVALGMASEAQIAHAVASHMDIRSRPSLEPRLRPSLRPPMRKPLRHRLH
ncbi:MAG TPA: hypothetical protein VEM57_06835 [Candidatus Binatus sp.]|nr:hypothetical protein [Candidatus Binatus sp.]